MQALTAFEAVLSLCRFHDFVKSKNPPQANFAICQVALNLRSDSTVPSPRFNCLLTLCTRGTPFLESLGVVAGVDLCNSAFSA